MMLLTSIKISDVVDGVDDINCGDDGVVDDKERC